MSRRRSLKYLRCLSLISALFGSFTATGDSTPNTDGVVARAQIEQLPITGMMKMTEADGSVKFLSTDRRFVFVGKMYDLWRGEAMTAGVASTQAIDWNRNGVSIDKISFPLGSKIGDNTLFIAPECADCRALLELSMANLSNNLNIVLLASTQAGNHDNALVWCSKDRVKGLTDVYIKKIKPSTSDINSGCDQFGLMLADQAALLFGIGQLPMFVDATGTGFTGEQAIYAVSNQGK